MAKRVITRTIQFFQPYQTAAGAAELTSENLRAAISSLNQETDTIATSLGDMRVHDRTPPGESNARVVLWLSQHEVSTLEQKGVERIVQIPDDTSFLQKTHLIFIDNQHVALLYNQQGPKLGDLQTFLREKLPALGAIKFRPLQSRNRTEMLRKMENISMIRLKTFERMSYFLDPNRAPAMQKFREGSQLLEAESFDLCLRGNAKTGFSQRAKAFIYEVMTVETPSEMFSKFSWKGWNPERRKVQELDLFVDKLYIRRSITLGAARRVTDDEAFDILLEAYANVADEVATSTPIEVEGSGLADIRSLIEQLI